MIDHAMPCIMMIKVNELIKLRCAISKYVTVEINYRLVSKDNVELWNEDKKLVYSPSNSSGGHGSGVDVAVVVRTGITTAALEAYVRVAAGRIAR